MGGFNRFIILSLGWLAVDKLSKPLFIIGGYAYMFRFINCISYSLFTITILFIVICVRNIFQGLMKENKLFRNVANTVEHLFVCPNDISPPTN